MYVDELIILKESLLVQSPTPRCRLGTPVTVIEVDALIMKTKLIKE